MPNYDRMFIPGGTFFLTVNLANRRSTLIIDEIKVLLDAIAAERDEHPFELPTWVFLPEHFHCLMVLPPGDTDYSNRIRRIKTRFSRKMPLQPVRASLALKGERGIWQRRFFEHTIRDELDLENHVNYIHFNPVKHGHVKLPTEWEYSSIHRFVKRGWLLPDWGDGGFETELDYG